MATTASSRLRPWPLALALGFALAAPAGAQTPATPGVNGGRPDQNPALLQERQRPPPGPLTTGGAAKLPAITPFTLRSVQIENASVPAAALEAAWRPFVGKTLDTAGLRSLTDALSGTFEANDVAIYTLLVPKQSFADGVLRIRVLEGHVEAVEVARAMRGGGGLVEGYAAKLESERPLKRSTLQRYVSLIRDIPGLNAELDLRNGRADDGVILTVTPAPDPLQAGLSINNRGTAFLGRTQMEADVYFNSLLRQGDRTRLTFAAPTDFDRFQAYALEQSEPLGSDGLTVTGNLGYVRTQPAGLPIVGHASSAGLQLSYPLIRSYDRDAYITAGVDGVDADNAFIGFRFSNERTRALRASISYSEQVGGRLVYGSATFSQGIEGLGGREDALLADADFRKLNARLGLNLAVGRLWVLRLAAAGQLTPDRLPATEQFALGGEPFGRGYPQATIAGDYGYGASAEAAWRPQRVPALLVGSEAYVFADGGQIWFRSRLGAATGVADVRSVGLGVRAIVGPHTVVQLEAAKPLPNRIRLLDEEGWRGVFAIKTLF